MKKRKARMDLFKVVVGIVGLILMAGGCSVSREPTASLDELVFVTVGPGVQRDSEKVWTNFNEQLKRYLPNTIVRFMIVPPDEIREKFDLMMVSNEQVDIAWTGFAFSFADEVSQGSYLPLDELIKNHAPKLFTETPAWILDLGKVGGTIYEIPRFEWMNEKRMSLVTPKDLYEKYWDSAEAEAAFFDTSGNYRTGTQAIYDAIDHYLGRLKAAGVIQSGLNALNWGIDWGTWLVDQGTPAMMRLPKRSKNYDFTVHNYYELSEVKLFYSKMAEYFEKGYIRKDILSLDDVRKYENFRSKDAYTAWFEEYIDASNPTSRTMDVVTEKGDRPAVRIALEPDYYISRIEAVSGQTVPRTAKHPDKAIRLIQLLNTKEGRDLFNTLVFGLEGVHYRRVSKNRIETLYYNGYPTAESPYGLPKWSVGNVRENAFLTQTETIDTFYDYMGNLPNIAIISPIVGFKPDTRSFRTKNQTLQALVSQYDSVLATGALGKKWEAYYVEFIRKLKAAGVDEAILEVQRQVDEYLAARRISKWGTIAR